MWRQLFSSILLIVSCISFIPTITPHEHSDSQNHDESSYCEGITENLNKYTNCSHESHLNKIKESCFLCNYCVVYTHLFIAHTIDSNDKHLIEKHYELCERLNFQEFINYSNKSPPVLI
jgi:hypothetical protein